MERYTKQSESGNYTVDGARITLLEEGLSGDAVERLAAFENIYEMILKEQTDIAQQLEALKNEDKSKTVTFQQLLAKKLTNVHLLSLFDAYIR